MSQARGPPRCPRTLMAIWRDVPSGLSRRTPSFGWTFPRANALTQGLAASANRLLSDLFEPSQRERAAPCRAGAARKDVAAAGRYRSSTASAPLWSAGKNRSRRAARATRPLHPVQPAACRTRSQPDRSAPRTDKPMASNPNAAKTYVASLAHHPSLSLRRTVVMGQARWQLIVPLLRRLPDAAQFEGLLYFKVL